MFFFSGCKIQYIRNVIEETHLPSTRHDPIGGIPGDLKETKKFLCGVDILCTLFTFKGVKFFGENIK